MHVSTTVKQPIIFLLNNSILHLVRHFMMQLMFFIQHCMFFNLLLLHYHDT